MLRMSRLQVVLIVSLLAMLGCQPPPPANPVASESPRSEPTPTPTASTSTGFWRLSAGSSGGITGGGGRREIWSDGSVFALKWDTAGSPMESEYQGQIGASDVETLEALLQKAQSIAHYIPSNMTISVEWTGENVHKYWAWEHGGQPPAPLGELKSAIGQVGPKEGTPPSWDGKPEPAATAILLLGAEDRSLNLMVGGQAHKAPLPDTVKKPSDLAGSEWDIAEGKVKVATVEGGWLLGEVVLKEKIHPYRMPVFPLEY